ncbi:MAG: DUF1295 domain-containing protein [Candidatus Schekmanbacteria bacterium]|nr:DUF1295 domain-containing protein [Candidatus Schekmanbacteria bacterium]
MPVVVAWCGVAVITGLALRIVPAPYGRHQRAGWGPRLADRTGWLVMESPAPLVFFALFFRGPHHDGLPALLFLAMWMIHYVHRAWIYPFRRARPKAGAMPVAIALMGGGFCAINAYLNARWIFALSGGYPATWTTDPRLIAGTLLFLAGLALNLHSDAVLRRLRRGCGAGYQVPYGGAYRWVSCPNYLGELIEWTGWAVATWSLAGLSFALWTAANLVPRALSHHDWYRRTFPCYPPRRRAILPLVL